MWSRLHVLGVWLSIKSCSRSRENVNRIEPCHTKTGLNCRGHHDHSMNKEEELEDLFSSYVLMQHWIGYLFFPFESCFKIWPKHRWAHYLTTWQWWRPYSLFCVKELKYINVWWKISFAARMHWNKILILTHVSHTCKWLLKQLELRVYLLHVLHLFEKATIIRLSLGQHKANNFWSMLWVWSTCNR